MKVGFIGLGLMGYNMACRLADTGFDLVVFNRTKSKALRFVNECGGEVVESPKGIGNKADIVHVMVSDNEAVGEVLLGSEGLLRGSSNRIHVIVSSTITPQFSLFLRNVVESSGHWYTEAPVLGSVSEARSGELITYVGGRPEDTKIQSVKALSRKVHYIGEVPKATALKLAINNLFLTSLASLAESIALGIAWGISLDQLLDLFKETWLKTLVERYEVRGFDRDFPTRFPIRLAIKDLRYVSDALSKVGMPSSLPSSAAEIYKNALIKGLSEKDYSNLLLYYKEIASGRKKV